MNSIEDRLDTLESLVDDQQATIEAHEETIAAQQATIEAQRERIAAVEDDGGVSMPMSRRGALTAGGALGLLGLGTGTASAQGSGRIGTPDTPVSEVYTNALSVNGNIQSPELLRLITHSENGNSGNFVSGFEFNRIEATEGAVISGGGGGLGDFINLISEDGDYGTISGGINNEVHGEAATVPGGDNNTAAGNYSFAVGRDAKARDNGAFVVGNSQDDEFESKKEDEARFQMNVVANAFELVEKRSVPGSDELADGEGLLYIADEDIADLAAEENDLLYSFNNGDTIETGVASELKI